MTIQEAESLLDEAIYADQKNTQFVVPDFSEIDRIGVMNFHIVYYDGGWSRTGIVEKVLTEKPQGKLVSILGMIIQARMSRDGYSEDTLRRMYNLQK